MPLTHVVRGSSTAYAGSDPGYGSVVLLGASAQPLSPGNCHTGGPPTWGSSTVYWSVVGPCGRRNGHVDSLNVAAHSVISEDLFLVA